MLRKGEVKMKILVAVDFSPIGREAAFRGYRYAQQLDAEVKFLHVVTSVANSVESYNLHFFVTPEARNTEQKVKEAAYDKLRRLADEIRGKYGELPHKKYEVTVDVANSPGGEILRVADDERYDVIIIGNKGYSTVERVLLGSTALKVINNAKCSVWLYRHTDYDEPAENPNEPESVKIWKNEEPLPTM